MVRAVPVRMDRYEDFKAWQLARALNMKVFEMTSKPPCVDDFRFRDNICDAADSAERNSPEGFGKFARPSSRVSSITRGPHCSKRKTNWTWAARAGTSPNRTQPDAILLTKRALSALSGLQKYLRSPTARENARRARENHARREHRQPRDASPGSPNEPPSNVTQRRTDEPPN